MFKVTKALQFCYGHRLLNYEGKCRFLHGHNGRVEIELEAEKLDSLAMVRDFTEVKEVVQTWGFSERWVSNTFNSQRRTPKCDSR